MKSNDKPYILHVAEKIYLEIFRNKKKNNNFSNTDAINAFIGSETYKEISSGKFHDEWFKQLENENKNIPDESMRLLKIQREMMIKQLIQYPELYYTKSNDPIKISKRAFDHLWRMCESYELWCKETDCTNKIKLNLI